MGPTMLRRVMCMTIDRAVGREVQGAPRANRPARVSFPDMDTNHLYAHLRPGFVLIIDDINTATIDRLFEFVREATLAPVPRHLEGRGN